MAEYISVFTLSSFILYSYKISVRVDFINIFKGKNRFPGDAPL